MKFEWNSSLKRGAKRVLEAFTVAFIKQITKRDFDSITVNDLCEESGYPRATFYNYFDDKYDLLNFLFMRLVEHVAIDDFYDGTAAAPYERIFDKVYDLIADVAPYIRLMMRNNPMDGYLFVSCKTYLIGRVHQHFSRLPVGEVCPVPIDMMAEFFCNTFWLVLERCFVKEPILPKETARAYMRYLLPDPYCVKP